MPFAHLLPRPFTQSAIRMYAPFVSGVYGISNAHEWIYIGEAGNIQDALLARLRDLRSSLMRHAPTGFVFEVSDRARRATRREQLIREYDPTCNASEGPRQEIERSER